MGYWEEILFCVRILELIVKERRNGRNGIERLVDPRLTFTARKRIGTLNVERISGDVNKEYDIGLGKRPRGTIHVDESDSDESPCESAKKRLASGLRKTQPKGMRVSEIEENDELQIGSAWYFAIIVSADASTMRAEAMCALSEQEKAELKTFTEIPAVVGIPVLKG
ncbi:LOW QUALITY PROTEIN: hypothetical protein BC937DRAFT_93633 [Endogone sp. FLAS-F59071]|nr:LOW QUALITY PROTEIN: hypothetical protein BC937DRAFT_93633 [Endogone sp. FLAS-F59071]|eukprot:RUS14565.1 LOW QUALITY PROTEIN: hypothetical protein BC937DRAFT_93633 [Endogone sp. FLAS-F59071]